MKKLYINFNTSNINPDSISDLAEILYNKGYHFNPDFKPFPIEKTQNVLIDVIEKTISPFKGPIFFFDTSSNYCLNIKLKDK